MLRPKLFAIASCLAVGVLVGCSAEKEPAAASRDGAGNTATASVNPNAQSPWSLLPAATDEAKRQPSAWEQSTQKLAEQPQSPAPTPEPAQETPENVGPAYEPTPPPPVVAAPPSVYGPGGALAVAPPPAYPPPAAYDSPAYEPPAYEPPAVPSYEQPQLGSQMLEPGSVASAAQNPLRLQEQPQVEQNPLRTRSAAGLNLQSFAPAEPAAPAPRQAQEFAPSYETAPPEPAPYKSLATPPAASAAAPSMARSFAPSLVPADQPNFAEEGAAPKAAALEPAAPAPEAAAAPTRMAIRSMVAEAPEALSDNAEALAEPSASAPADAASLESDRAEATDMARVAMGAPPLSTNSSAENPAVTSSDPGQQFHTVTVFYGTDRMSSQAGSAAWSDRVARFWPTAVALLSATLFGFIAATWKRVVSAVLSVGSLGVAIFLGGAATLQTIEHNRLAEKEGVRYIAERALDGEVQVGVCEVTIPKTHKPGELEAPSILRLEVREDAERHVVLQKTEPLPADEFHRRLRQRVAASPGEEMFVFVHGFNVSFENAARRTAQMAYDLKYEGAPVFFSWPANDKFLLTYAQDETNVSWAAPHLKRFLLDIARNSEAKSINVIAHSMGNRALTAVLRELELEFRDDARLFNQVVLAAPDIDADDFRLNIAPYIQKTSRRITLYASSNDQALAASQLVHRYPRAGDSGSGLLVVPGIETVDVSAIDGGPWGHSYYGSSDPILRDLAILFRGENLAARSWLLAQDLNGMQYWVFQAQTASARAAGADTLR